MATQRAFLNAEWRDLVVLNYEIDPLVLKPYIPDGTKLDLWRGSAFVSIVAFRFLKTRVLGISFPFHRNFEEINLRFYVRRETSHESRAGVVFIKELVPRTAIAWVARAVYNENYFAVPMGHEILEEGEERSLAYRWTEAGRINYVGARTMGLPHVLEDGTHARFILEHYWGYSRARSGGTFEYHVAHPPWRMWQADSVRLDMRAGDIYGEPFGVVLSQPCHSAYVAEGSAVTVHCGEKIELER